MKSAAELTGIHPGSDIYVVGTGPSLRVFPLEVLQDKITIGLNDAYRFFPVKYAVTVHPDLYVPEFAGQGARPDLTWVVKRQKIESLELPEHRRYASERFYAFDSEGQANTQGPGEPRDSGRVLDWVRRTTGDFLYLWSSIAQTAANLAANMGAKNIFLVGCDADALGGNDHAHAKPTRWKGADPADRYRQYYEGLAEVRGALRERGVRLMSLTPFIGSTRADEDFERLCRELGKPAQVAAPFDRSPRPGPRERLQGYRDRLFGALARRTASKGTR